jgi:hypothetical protein
VWNAIFRWLGVIIVLPSDVFVLFDCLTGAAANKKIGKGIALIWHTTVWGFGNQGVKYPSMMVSKTWARWLMISNFYRGGGI